MFPNDTSKVTLLVDLRQRLNSGDITREMFWNRMKEYHLNLTSYPKLLVGSEIARIVIGTDGIFLQLHNGFEFLWNINEIRSIPSVVVNFGSLDQSEFAVLRKMVGGFKVIFDVGANIGWHALHLLTLIGEGDVQIHAFEPIPETFSVLKQNISRNNKERNVLAWNVAFGDEDKDVSFFIPQFTGYGAASQRPILEEEENVEVLVHVQRIDDFVKKNSFSRLDMIKCDVEGGEQLVFKGAKETISRFSPVIYVEMLRKWANAFGYHPNDTIALMNKLDYACWSIDNGRLVLLHEMTEHTVEKDFFFLHKDHHQELLRRING